MQSTIHSLSTKLYEKLKFNLQGVKNKQNLIAKITLPMHIKHITCEPK